MAISITCKEIIGKGWHMTYKFILPCMGRFYRSSISTSPSLRMDPGFSILGSSSIWSLLLPHLLCLVGGSISLSSAGTRSSLLTSHVLASSKTIFSHIPFTFEICIVPHSCNTGDAESLGALSNTPSRLSCPP